MWWIELVKWVLIAIAIVAFLSLLKFEKVEEAQAKAVMRFKGFKKMIMSFEEYRFAKDWEIIPAPKKKRQFSKIQSRLDRLFKSMKEKLRLGGLRFVGIRGIDTIYKYHFRWTDYELVAGELKVSQHDKKDMDYILVKDVIYVLPLRDIETKPPERIKLSFIFALTIRVVNPRKALFVGPPNWLENVMTKISPVFVGWVNKNTVNSILEIRREGPQRLWNEFKDDPVITKIVKDKWGVEILENGIGILDLTMPPEIAAAAARKRQLEWEAKAKKTQFEIEAKARASETVGTVIEMMAKARGKKVKKIQAEIETKPRLRKEFLRLANDLIVRKMGIEGAAYVDIRVEGPPRAEGKIEGQGFLPGLIDKFAEAMIKIEAAKQRMPRGRKEERRGTKERKDGEDRESKEVKEDEKILREAETIYKGGK